MSKKHFQALAETVKGLQVLREDDRYFVALALADMCQGFNARFSRARFLDACGFKGEA
ncbi:MAG: hypothetical protein M0R06_23430 [Sphaerochaeta sp.]|jgi:hypothetical protein|nr:hypothetical protein [Sphaerochaeta sp.]